MTLIGVDYSDTVPAGIVMSQDPMPETFADVGSEIVIRISGGPSTRQLPDLRGWKEPAARTYLEGLGYRVQEVKVSVSSYERGRVDSMNPSAGTALIYLTEYCFFFYSDTKREKPC